MEMKKSETVEKFSSNIQKIQNPNILRIQIKIFNVKNEITSFQKSFEDLLKRLK